MPKALPKNICGWRLFFYSNERNEPIHVHCKKAEIRCKFWIGVDDFSIRIAYALNASQRDLREIKKIVYEHFDDIVEAWNAFQERKHGKVI